MRNVAIRIFGLLGVLTCLYAIYVEYQKKASPDFVAFCDISEKISCSKVLTSEDAHFLARLLHGSKSTLLYQSNSVYGSLYYVATILYTLYPFTSIPFKEWMFFGASLLSIAISFYLAYALFILGDICLVCLTTYVINGALFWLSWRELRDPKDGTPKENSPNDHHIKKEL
jgi:vitamin-K-epoxide reductase (warfarin-sensitive)